MSDLNNNSVPTRREENLLNLAENEMLRRTAAEDVAQVEALRRAEAEQIAARQAVRGDVAATIAAEEALRRHQAENAAVDARISANQAHFQAAQLDTERTVLRENLAKERVASSNANFGLTLFAAIALAGLIGFGIWYATGSNLQANNAAAPTNTTARTTDAGASTGRAATVTTPPPSAPSSTTVIVQPVREVHTNANNAHTAKPKPKAELATNGSKPVKVSDPRANPDTAMDKSDED